MEKQHNRGQDGAGIGSMKLNMPAGEAFMFRERSTSSKALAKIFGGQHKRLSKLVKEGTAFPEFPDTIKQHFDYGGEILLGHLDMGHLEITGQPLAIHISEKVTGLART